MPKQTNKANKASCYEVGNGENGTKNNWKEQLHQALWKEIEWSI